MEKLSNRQTGELCLAETARIQENLSAWDCGASLVRKVAREWEAALEQNAFYCTKYVLYVR